MYLPDVIGLDNTRRSFLGRSLTGIGAAALASLLDPKLLHPNLVHGGENSEVSGGVIQERHFPAKVKRVIWLCMAGGMSHLETFDHKPALEKMHGQPMPDSYTAGQPIAQLQGQQLKCFAPQHPFGKHGQSGQEISDIFPNLAKVADDLCIIRSLKTEAINHDPAHTFINTGSTVSGRPSMGSWLLYGLGAETDDLPGFVVLTSSGKYGQNQPIASRQWSAGFLPSNLQGVHFHSKGDPVLFVSNPHGVDGSRQADVVSAVNRLNTLQHAACDDPEIVSRIAQYEMAFKMQTSVPRLTDIAGESQQTLDLYGAKPGDGSYASNCLLARRLAERGVRFIQLYHRDWDHHGGIKEQIRGVASEVDQATMALILDLKQRGMLNETLLVFGGEFGRTPMAQGNGRDHHIKGFSMWMAGGGIKGGITHGATDELGYNAVEKVVPVHDLHATMLYLLGIDHLRLIFRTQGRDYRLTDVSGEVVREILA